MGYVVSVGNGMYLKRGVGTKLTSDKMAAYQWDTQEKAINVSYAFSKQFPDTCVEEVESINEPSRQPEENFSREYTVDEVADLLKDLSLFLSHRKRVLEKLMSEADKRIVDIEHEAEFNKYNVCNGYKCYKKLHDARVKRREAKNEWKQIEFLSGVNISNPSTVERAMKSIENMSNRKYRQRLKEEYS